MVARPVSKSCIVSTSRDQFSLNPLHRANPGPGEPGGLNDTDPACQLDSDCFNLGLREWGLTNRLAALGPVLASPLHPGFDPLLDDRALELGEHPEHLEQGASGWCRRVNRLVLKIEIAPDRAQFGEKADEVLQRAPKPIDRPCRDNVNLAGRCRFQKPIEAGALFSTLGAADPLILELLDDPPAPRLARRDQPNALCLDRMIAR